MAQSALCVASPGAIQSTGRLDAQHSGLEPCIRRTGSAQDSDAKYFHLAIYHESSDVGYHLSSNMLMPSYGRIWEKREGSGTPPNVSVRSHYSNTLKGEAYRKCRSPSRGDRHGLIKSHDLLLSAAVHT